MESHWFGTDNSWVKAGQQDCAKSPKISSTYLSIKRINIGHRRGWGIYQKRQQGAEKQADVAQGQEFQPISSTHVHEDPSQIGPSFVKANTDEGCKVQLIPVWTSCKAGYGATGFQEFYTTEFCIVFSPVGASYSPKLKYNWKLLFHDPGPADELSPQNELVIELRRQNAQTEGMYTACAVFIRTHEMKLSLSS